MRIEGEFTVNPNTPFEQRLKNTLVSDGASYFLRTLFRAEAVLPANFYIGLTNANPGFDLSTLVAIAAGEPNTAQGYARQPAVRNTTDWTVTEINGAWRARSKLVTFTASGTYSIDWVRLFLCNLVSGTGGNVFSLSAPAIAPNHVLVGGGPSVVYDFWMRP